MPTEVEEEQAPGQEEILQASPLLATITLPENNQKITLNLFTTDRVNDVRHFLLDIPSSCYWTCFDLEFNGEIINSVTQFGLVPGLESTRTAEFKLIPSTYSDCAVRIHMQRVKELLLNQRVDKTGAFSNEIYNPSFFNSVVTDDDTQKETPTLQVDKRPLNAVYTPPCDTDDQADIKCLQSISWSGWSPPTTTAMFQGDILYIKVITLEGSIFHITAHTGGFFVNRSTEETFDRREHPTRPCRSATLIGLLVLLSPKFKAGFTKLQLARDTNRKHPLINSPTPYKIFSWMGTHEKPTYKQDISDVAYPEWSENDPRLPGILRDWNDELQTARELNESDDGLKPRSLFKFDCDYVCAVTRGAKAVALNNIYPINEMDTRETHMYTWNNVFFSFANDGRGIFKDQGGNEAAHAAAANDLRGAGEIANLGVDGLNTLGTVIVDFAGLRIVAQTIVPGILRHGDGGAVVYGVNEIIKKMVIGDNFKSLLEKASPGLHTKPHKIKYGPDEEEYEIHSSSDCKGILGTDGRMYALDLTRVFPMDSNFVDPELRIDEEYEGATIYDLSTKSEDGKIHVKETKDKSWKPRHQFLLVRPRLIEFYKNDIISKHMKAHSKDTNTSENAEDASTAATEIKDKDGEKKNETESAENDPEPLPEDTFLFNPDAFTTTKLGGTVEEQAADRKQVAKLGTFLNDIVIPQLVSDICTNKFVACDGEILRDVMHGRGIGMRYLGQIAASIMKTENSPKYLGSLCVMEMAARVAKFFLREQWKSVEVHRVAETTVTFLNTLLSKCPNPSGKSGKKKKQKDTSNQQKQSLWKKIRDKIYIQFRCRLSETFLEDFKIEELPLLRSICLKCGVELQAREYNFNSKTPTFTVGDIVELHPVVKHNRQKCIPGMGLETASSTHLQNGNIKTAWILAERANQAFQFVFGALHPSVAQCHRLCGLISLQLEGSTGAESSQTKATVISERVLGRDHAETITNYIHLGQFYFSARKIVKSLQALQYARDLCLICLGKIHPEIPSLNIQISLALMSIRKDKTAIQFLEQMIELEGNSSEPSLLLGHAHMIYARAKRNIGDLRGAVAACKTAHTIYTKKCGENDPQTLDCLSKYKTFATEAVQMEKYKKMSKSTGNTTGLTRVKNIKPGTTS
eukprot:m.21613 g.21613  ORF g.21613 m.21613 type:complete len:1144 (-) comp7190_c0_seq1:132-3563(-)